MDSSLYNRCRFLGRFVLQIGLYSACASLVLCEESITMEASHAGEVKFYDARELTIEGKAWEEEGAPFSRLPASAKGLVRERVWQLGGNTTGLCVRFVTDATNLYARWTLTSPKLGMNHMPATGVSGLDLYVKSDNGEWRWLAVGAPEQKTNAMSLISGLPEEEREYLLYFPLYNGLVDLEIGVPSGATFREAAPRDAQVAPIVFYGTSITQGGCASRPGACYVAILGRRLGLGVINLGFSSNGTMDLEIAQLLADVEASAFVVDCLPNMTKEMVAQRTQPFVKAIRDSHPTTPILLVEDRTCADAFLLPARREEHEGKRAVLRREYQTLIKAGYRNIAYLAGDNLLPQNGEGTVDGSHPTDIGFVHIADQMEPVLKQLLQTQ